MNIEITHVRYASASKTPKTISHVRWRDSGSQASGSMGAQALLAWIRHQRGEAYVCAGGACVNVGIVDSALPYLRSRVGDSGADALTALPEF